MKTEAYEYYAEYIGGPADGLRRNIIVFDDIPPDITCLELNHLIEARTPLGQYFFKQRPEGSVRVGVYMLENEPEEYDEDDVLTYIFIEMTSYEEYLEEYTND